MASNSLRFRIEADNSSAIRGLSEVQAKAKGLGKDLQEEVGKKLQSAFSVTVIEEAVRRTGEWATTLAKSAQQLGVGTDALQALQVAAERSGVPIEKINTFYDKVESNALKALSGNQKLRDSFKALGIDIAALKSTPATALVQQMFAGAKNPGGQGALLNIFGTKNLREVSALGREMGGKSIEQYGEEHKSQIVPNEQVSQMATAWTHIIEDVRSIGSKLAPIASLLLIFVDGVLKMVNGLFGEFGNILEGMKLTIKSWLPSFLGGSKKGSVEQRQNDIALNEWSAKRELRNQAFVGGLKSFATLGIKGHDKIEGLSEEEQREASGGAEGLASIATFGVGGIAKAIGGGVKGAGAASEMVGLSKLGETMGTAGEAIGNTGAGTFLEDGLFGTAKNYMIKRKVRAYAAKRIAAMRRGGTTQEEIMANLPNLEKEFYRKFSKQYQQLGNVGMVLNANAAGGIGTRDVESDPLFNYGNGNNPTSTNRNPLLNLGGIGSLFGGGSNNLSMGGVFGADLQGKIIALNTQQVSLLQKIVENTNTLAEQADDYTEQGSSSF